MKKKEKKRKEKRRTEEGEKTQTRRLTRNCDCSQARDLDGTDARALRRGIAQDDRHRAEHHRIPAPLPHPRLRQRTARHMREGRRLARRQDDAQHTQPRSQQENEEGRARGGGRPGLRLLNVSSSPPPPLAARRCRR
jgi:hypothetical protein